MNGWYIRKVLTTIMLELALDRILDTQSEDRALLRRISKGDAEALEVLYQRYGGQLYAYALRILGEQTAAEDVIQETLLAVWQGAGKFRGEGRSIAWLYRIVHNKAMRSFRVKESLPLDEQIERSMKDTYTPEDQLQVGERRALLREGLSNLSVEHRTVLELVFYQGMSLKETAAICQVPVGTIKSRLKYARDALKGALSRQGISTEDLR